MTLSTVSRKKTLESITAEQQDALKRLWVKLLANKGKQKFVAPAPEPSPAKSGWFGGAKSRLLGGGGAEQDAAKALAADPLAGYSWEEFINQLSYLIHVDHPDTLMIRFIIARKLDVDAAYKMIVETVKFFEDEGLNTVKLQGEPNVPQYPLENGLMYYYGNDKQGNSVAYVNAKHNNPKKHSVEEFAKYILYQMTLGYILLGDNKSTIVFDLEGFGLNNVDYHGVKYLFSVLANNFPESLARVIVCNAPWIFNGVWNVISGFLDPVVKEKILFAKGEELSKYIDIDQIPSDKLGKADFKYTYTPPTEAEARVLNEPAAKAELLAERERILADFIKATENWINGNGTNELRTQLADQAAYNYRKLAPHIWSQSILHRQGVITDFDQVDFSKYSN